jgi:transposase
MQDNPSIHAAKKVIQWCEDYAILLLDWPPYSPDMNPIKHVWAITKKWIVKHYPELLKMGKSQAAYNQSTEVIVEAWNAIDQEYIDKLIRGMAEWVKTLRVAKGWHTKY